MSSPRSNARPVIVLGVARSGTTLLKELLTSHSQLAIPSESHFVPVLWDRSRFRRTRARLLRDLHQVERLSRWGVSPADVEQRVDERSSFADVIRTIYECYAAGQAKPRFGDKTPIYVEYLGVLERVFPDAQYVHIIRDGRDAALSYLSFIARRPGGPELVRSLAGYACRWRESIERTRRHGRRVREERYLELRYEDLVTDTEGVLRTACGYLGLEFEATMLRYYERFSATTSQSLLSRPPGPGRSDWRAQMTQKDLRRFEAVAGDLLEELGYGRALPRASVNARARATAQRASYAVARTAWLTGTATYRALPFISYRGP